MTAKMMTMLHLRKVDIAPLMLRPLPYELGTQLVSIIRVRDGGALRDCLGVVALLPFANPFIWIGITRLQKEATEGLRRVLIQCIDDHRDLLPRMIALCTGHHLKGISVSRLWSCLAMIGLIRSLLDTCICRGAIRECHCALEEEHEQQ